MAKKKRSGGSSGAAEVTSTDAPARGRRGLVTAVVGVLLVLGGAGAGYAVWHKRSDPSHVWAMQFQQARAGKLERQLQRCFGGSDGAALRHAAPEIRQGNWPDPFRHCAGSPMTEMVSSAMDLESDLRNPPPPMENARARERGKLEHLRIALGVLQRASAFPRDRPPPDAARDAILTALEDAAVDVDAERQSFGDLLDTADNAASIW